ncbi:MAG: hypothetical protein ACJ790_09525 [Myxococcaceae bacterium]
MSSSIIPSCPRCRKPMQPKVAKTQGSPNVTSVFECADCVGLVVEQESLTDISPRLNLYGIKRGDEGDRTCQRCERKMLRLNVRHLFQKVQLDECPICRDVYFDFAELGRAAGKPVHVGELDELPKAHHSPAAPPVSELMSEWLRDL